MPSRSGRHRRWAMVNLSSLFVAAVARPYKPAASGRSPSLIVVLAPWPARRPRREQRAYIGVG